jgi:hypothetical protein
VAACELGDPVAPLRRSLEVEHGRARADEEAGRPRTRDRNRRLFLQRGHGCLVEAAHAFLDLCGRDERGPLEGEPQHLQIGDAELPTQLGGGLCELPGMHGVAPAVSDVALVESEPAVVGPSLERVEQSMSPLQPAARDRGCCPKVELVDGQPRRHTGRAGGVTSLPVQAIRT